MSDIDTKYLTDDHLTWLVESRSRNQKSGLDLHIALAKNRIDMRSPHDLIVASQHLVAINFSLWRAVFLSDISDESDHLLRDAQSFLKNLVANNAVAYPQDRKAREWTFVYYMENATYRLRMMKDGVPDILPDPGLKLDESIPDKDWWNECQRQSEIAIENLTKRLEAENSN